MLFKFVHRFKYAFIWVYSLVALAMIGMVGYAVYSQSHCDNCTFFSINPSTYLVPIIAYLSIGLVGVTIGFNRKTASEKNALDFAKEMTALTPHMKSMAEIRKGMLLNNGNLNRRKASEYMESLSDLKDPKSTISGKEGQASAKDASGEKTTGKETPGAEQATVPPQGAATDEDNAKSGEQAGPSSEAKPDGAAKADESVNEPGDAKSAGATKPNQAETDWGNRVAAFALLNALESCANAVRYEIYDEDFIYNIYGSHFIEWYELCYGLIKTRQLKQERIWVNFEWLAVKWTLRRNITGVISNESLKTSYIINEALQALKSHNKTRPIKRKLKKFEKQLERRKFPM